MGGTCRTDPGYSPCLVRGWAGWEGGLILLLVPVLGKAKTGREGGKERGGGREGGKEVGLILLLVSCLVRQWAGWEGGADPPASPRAR